MIGRKRHPLASVGLHGTLGVASVVAVLPVASVALTSLKQSESSWSQPGNFTGLGLGNYRRVFPGGVKA